MKKATICFIIIITILTFGGCSFGEQNNREKISSDYYQEDIGSEKNNNISAENNSNISVSDIIISETQINLKINQTYTLSVTVLPLDATNKDVVWQSSNNKIITVNNGFVEAKGVGSAVVRVSAKDNSKIYSECSFKIDGDYSLTIDNSLPLIFNKEYTSYGAVLQVTTLTINTISYSFERLSSAVWIHFYITYAKENKKTNYYSLYLQYKIYDEYDILVDKGSCLMTGDGNEITKTDFTAHIKYESEAPTSAKFKVMFSV